MNTYGTLYRNLLWIARHARIKDGWAWYRYKDAIGVEPAEWERGEPIIPSFDMVAEHGATFCEYRRSRLFSDYEYAMLTDAQKAEKKAENVRNKKFKARARKALDGRRPKLEDL